MSAATRCTCPPSRTVLSQTRDPHAVQPHLIKCFDAVKRLQFGDGDDSKKMLALVSAESEIVKLTTPPTAEGAVEDWLMAMQRAMMESLYQNCKSSWLQLGEIQFVTDSSYSEARQGSEGGALDEWFFGFPAQCIIMIGQIEWTYGVECALIKIKEGGGDDALKVYSEKWIQSIDYMVGIVRRQLTPLQRRVIGAKLTLDVHCRDTNAELCHLNVGWVNEFEWQKQLRYYWDEDTDDCGIRQTNTFFRYGYEYLGNSMRLVVTPLTDKCYMTLTGGLNLGMGGAPAGPAGTGKTETTKDLAKVDTHMPTPTPTPTSTPTPTPTPTPLLSLPPLSVFTLSPPHSPIAGTRAPVRRDELRPRPDRGDHGPLLLGPRAVGRVGLLRRVQPHRHRGAVCDRAAGADHHGSVQDEGRALHL